MKRTYYADVVITNIKIALQSVKPELKTRLNIDVLKALVGKLHKAALHIKDDDIFSVAKALIKGQKVEFDFTINGRQARGVIDPEKDPDVISQLQQYYTAMLSKAIDKNISEIKSDIDSIANEPPAIGYSEPIPKAPRPSKSVFKKYIDTVKNIAKQSIEKISGHQINENEYRFDIEPSKSIYNSIMQSVNTVKAKLNNMIDSAKQAIRDAYHKTKTFFRGLER